MDAVPECRRLDEEVVPVVVVYRSESPSVRGGITGRVGDCWSCTALGVMARGKFDPKTALLEARRRGLRVGGSRDEEVEKVVRSLRSRRRLWLSLRLPDALSRFASLRFEERRDEAKRGLIILLLARLRMKDCRFSARGLVSTLLLSLLLTRRMLRLLSAPVRETVGMERELRFSKCSGTGKSDVRNERGLVPRVFSDMLLLGLRLNDRPPLILLRRVGRRTTVPCISVLRPALWEDCQLRSILEPRLLGDSLVGADNRNAALWLCLRASSVAAE